jgi:hypothetical protein
MSAKLSEVALNWRNSLLETYDDVTQQILESAPQLLGAILLLLVGWLIAHSMQSLTKKIIIGFDLLFKKTTKLEGVKKERIKNSYAIIISKVVFWIIILFFASACANMLDLTMFSNLIDSIISYLPNLLMGILIVLGGFLLSNIGYSTFIGAASSTGIVQVELLARAVQGTIIFATAVIGVEQMGIQVSFLTTLLIVVVGVFIAGGALAFSIGAKSLVENAIGAQYLRKYLRVGDNITVLDIEGEILDITQTSVILETNNGQVFLPAKVFHEQVINFGSHNMQKTVNIKKVKSDAKKRN